MSDAKFMVDRVAEAIARVAITQKKPNFNALAKAALLALRHPDDEMIAAVGSDWGPQLQDNWRKMIDEALK